MRACRSCGHKRCFWRDRGWLATANLLSRVSSIRFSEAPRQMAPDRRLLPAYHGDALKIRDLDDTNGISFRPLESKRMTERARKARWTHVALVSWLVATGATVRAQEAGATGDREKAVDRSSESPAGLQKRRGPAPERETAARQETSRWQAVKEGIWPFRSRRENADSKSAPRNAPSNGDQRGSSGKSANDAVPPWRAKP